MTSYCKLTYLKSKSLVIAMTEKFRTAFIAHVPDADPVRHRCVIETSLYELTSVLVRDDDQAVEMCRELVEKNGIQSFILCPGFTHRAIARIVEAVGDGVSVNVARGDGPSNEIALKIMRESGWFTKREGWA